MTYEDVHRTRHDFLIVHAAVIPTRVFPAPQGRTIIPDLARLLQDLVSAFMLGYENGMKPTHFRTFYSNLFLGMVG
jgi:hypothetical protein